MNNATRRYGGVALLMAAIVAVSAGITHFTGTVGMNSAADTFMVLTTVNPLFAAAKTVTAGVEGVQVENLTGSATGCLHDYQLSPANRISLQQADLLILNGAGAEAFLTDVLPQLTNLTVTDTGEGISLLEGHEEHHHDHEDEDEDEHDHEEEYNEHIWTSPARYSAQVRTMTAALCAMDPAHTAQYTANSDAYLARIADVAAQLQTAADALPDKNCVTFHDSLAYLAEDLGLTVVQALSVGEESGVSAGDLALAQQTVQADPGVLLLYDSQYAVDYTMLNQYVPDSAVMTMDSAVIGHGSNDDWLNAMEINVTLLRGASGAAERTGD